MNSPKLFYFHRIKIIFKRLSSFKKSLSKGNFRETLTFIVFSIAKIARRGKTRCKSFDGREKSRLPTIRSQPTMLFPIGPSSPIVIFPRYLSVSIFEMTWLPNRKKVRSVGYSKFNVAPSLHTPS